MTIPSSNYKYHTIFTDTKYYDIESQDLGKRIAT